MRRIGLILAVGLTGTVTLYSVGVALLAVSQHTWLFAEVAIVPAMFAYLPLRRSLRALRREPGGSTGVAWAVAVTLVLVPLLAFVGYMWVAQFSPG